MNGQSLMETFWSIGLTQQVTNSITWGKHSEGHQVPLEVPFEFLALKAKVKGICSKEY